MNNLFDFATSELSQDAVICWCVNWFNDDSNPALKKMATEIIERIFRRIIEKTPDFTFSKIESVHIKRQLSKKVPDEEGKDIAVKIDVLLLINKSIALIIEDKTNTSEHGEQITRYRDGLQKMIKEDAISKDELESIDSFKIKTVYWKTGFYTDYDRAVKADAMLFRSEILSLLTPYRSENQILGNYISYLESIDKREETEKRYWAIAEECDSLWGKYPYLSYSHVGQYELIRDCFPFTDEIIKPGKFYEPFQVYHGTSFGRPWTEMIILYGYYPSEKEESKHRYCVFWRIDTNKKGPYLSLRLYADTEEWKKNNSTLKNNHRAIYNKFRENIYSILQNADDSIKINKHELIDTNNGSYREASFFSWKLEHILENYPAERTRIIDTVRYITKEFQKHQKDL